MNKSDFKLIIFLLIPTLIVIFLLVLKKDNGPKIAVVYYENEEILTINLNNNLEKIYNVQGYNGNVKIVTKDGKIKVDEENSPKHICSKQGFISESYETIICLPNKIIIKIQADDYYDTVVG